MNGFTRGFSLFLFLILFTVASSVKAEGVDTYFKFGIGVQGGFGDQAVSTLVGSLRFLNAAALEMEFDLNRVAVDPSESNSSVEDLLFVPNFKLLGVIYLFREKRYAPYASAGIGIDLGTPDTRINLMAGTGVEIQFLRDIVFLNFGLRFFFPRPVDVERQREQMFMDGRPSVPSYTAYYNFDTYQITLSLRFVY